MSKNEHKGLGDFLIAELRAQIKERSGETLVSELRSSINAHELESARLNNELNAEIARRKIEMPQADESEWPKPPSEETPKPRFDKTEHRYPPGLWGW